MSGTNDESQRSHTHTDSDQPRSSADDETVVRSSDPSFPDSVPQQVELPEEFGRYRILRALGRGGMGSVFLAEDTQLQRQVALKVPHFTQDGRPGVVERFNREARAMATLNHPNLCPVFDVGEINGTHYLTMAYIDGEDLSHMLADSQRRLAMDAVSLVQKLAAALGEAHKAGIIHRDLKPSNIIIDRRGEPIVMDFGLARRENQDDPQLTRDGAIVGTPSYMSPEQVEGDPDTVGPTSDIYCLGVIFYQLLCGQSPFSGNVAVIMSKILSSQFDPPTSVRGDIDPRLEAICLRALERQPTNRFATMEEFGAALDEYRGGPTSRTLQARRSAETALLDGYRHDVLVSFLAADDEPPPGQPEGWVTTLVDNLVWRLRQLGGYDAGLSIWFDCEIQESHVSDWQQRLDKSAVHLLVVSPGFLAAAGDQFFQAVQQRLQAGNPVVMVERDRLDTEPFSALESVRAFVFWEDNPTGPRILGFPVIRPELDTAYYAKIDDLARQLHSHIRDLADSNASASASEPSGPRVYLAEVTDDLDAARTELARYLDQFGIETVPASWHPRDADEFCAAVQRDLRERNTVLFVQLVSELAGKSPPGEARTYLQLQYDLAVKHNVPILQWRPDHVDPQQVTSAGHRRLIDGEDIQVVELEQFKRTVVQRVNQEVARQDESSQHESAEDEAFVFVNVERGDSEIADDLCEILDESGCSYATPIYEGRPDEIRHDLEANLLDCDGLIVVYGAATEQWVREQLRQWRKILFRRDKPIKALAIFEGPPPEKGRLGMRLPKMTTIDCRGGLDASRVRDFIEALTRREA